MIGLDTNVLVRYVAQDDPKQSPKASALIESFSISSPEFIPPCPWFNSVGSPVLLRMCQERNYTGAGNVAADPRIQNRERRSGLAGASPIFGFQSRLRRLPD